MGNLRRALPMEGVSRESIPAVSPAPQPQPPPHALVLIRDGCWILAWLPELDRIAWYDLSRLRCTPTQDP